MATNTSHERNLLFAGLGLQLSLLTKEHLVRAFSEWILNKNLSLGEILVQQGAIKEEQKKAIEGAIDAQIQNDGGEVQALASIKNSLEIEASLKGVEDQELEMTLCTMNALQSRKIIGNDLASHRGSHPALPIIRPAEQRFQRSNFLDAGSLGEIWFAKDEELNRTVVLKYIKGDQQNSPFTKALFNLEGEVTGYLEHPAVVPVYSMGQDDKGRNFYAMRYIHGRKLTRAIADYHALPLSASGKKREALTDLLQIFQTACLAIEYAHSKGVLHCDLKPDNIVVGPFGETLVIDWGLAMVTNPKSEIGREINNLENIPMTADSGKGVRTYSPSQSAQPGLHFSQGGLRKFVGGTPAYMGPEQMRATRGGQAEVVTHSCDIFSLGATLYHLLTSRAPFIPNKEKRENYSVFVQRIELGEFPVPRHLNSGIPKPLEAVVLKAMAAKPQDRYGTARELAEEVKRWLADEPVLAYRETVVEKSRRWARNHRTAVVAGTVFLFCLAFGSMGIALLAQRHTKQLQISEKEARSQESLAKEQRALAEKRETLAIAAVKQFADAVKDNPELKNRTDLEPLRKELLKEPIHFFKEFSSQLRSEKNPSPKSLSDLAGGLFSLARLTDQIGNQEDAIRSYKEIVTIRENLAKTNPTDSKSQSELALSHNHLAIILKKTNRPKEVEAHYQKALTIRESLVKTNPANADFQADLAISYNNLALWYLVTKRITEAESSYQKALAIQEPLVKTNPTNSDFQSDLGNTHNNLANLFLDTKRPNEAVASFQKALAIQEALVKTHPTIPEFQSELARSHNNLAHLQEQKEAEASFQKALSIQEALVKTNPTNSAFQSELASSLTNLALLYAVSNRPQESEASYNKAIAIQESLVKANPTNSRYQSGLARSYSNFGLLYRGTNRPREAESCYIKAIPILESLLKANPLNSDFQSDLASFLNNLAVLYNNTNRQNEAEVAYLKALVIRESLVKSNPTIPRYQSDLENLKINIANLWNNEARKLVFFPTKGEEEFKKGLGLAQEALKLNPENGLIIITLGIAQYRVKQFAAALDTLQQSNRINAKANGKKVPKDLAFLAMTCHQLGKKADAENYFKELEESMKDKKNNENQLYQWFFKEAETLLKK